MDGAAGCPQRVRRRRSEAPRCSRLPLALVSAVGLAARPRVLLSPSLRAGTCTPNPSSRRAQQSGAVVLGVKLAHGAPRGRWRWAGVYVRDQRFVFQ